jgi:cation transport regulator ChaC
VATLVPEEGSTCWGMAYQVAPEEHSAVLSRLDHREKGGYERHEVSLELPYAEETVNALVYLAGPTNPHYLGPAPLETIAAQVRRSRGPSGPNVEYVVRLAEALEQMRADDPHVFALAAFVSEPWAT